MDIEIDIARDVEICIYVGCPESIQPQTILVLY